MEETLIPQGSDQKFEVTCKDDAGTVLDFSTGYNNIVIIIYNADKTILEKFSRTTTAGWEAIDVSNQATGRLSFKLLSAVTNLAKAGKKYFEIRVQKTDVTVGDGNYDMIVNDKYLCSITASITSTITLP